jgi:hypothetical protein
MCDIKHPTISVFTYTLYIILGQQLFYLSFKSSCTFRTYTAGVQGHVRSNGQELNNQKNENLSFYPVKQRVLNVPQKLASYIKKSI